MDQKFLRPLMASAAASMFSFRLIARETVLGMSAGLSLLNTRGGKPFVFDKGPSYNHCVEAVSGNGMSFAYMYDELRYRGIPSKENAKRLLADLKAGRAIPHPISDPGYEQRLEDIIAGRSVDPACFGVRPSVDSDAQGVVDADCPQ